jgi:lysyl-tRNA synthetase class II
VTLESQQNQSYQARIQHLEANDITPYPFTFDRSCSLIDVHQDFSHVQTGSHGERIDLRLCGHVTGIRLTHEGVVFYVDDQQAQLQFALEYAEVGNEGAADFRENVCAGDYAGFYIYRIGRDASGELTAYVYHWVMVAAADRQSSRAAGAHLAARQRLILRSKLTRGIRRCLEDWYGFYEVSLPCAPPTSTLADVEPATALLQLVSSGFETVYQVVVHPDDAAAAERLHACMALSDQNDMMGLTERLFRELALDLKGRRVLPWAPQPQLGLNASDMTETAPPDEHDLSLMIDLETTWQQRDYFALLAELTGIDFRRIASSEEAAKVAHSMGIVLSETESVHSVSDIASAVFRQFVTPQLIQPTFVVNFPVTANPQKPRHLLHHRLIACGRLFINGLEFAQTETVVSDPHGVKQPSGRERSPGKQHSIPLPRRQALPQTSSLILDIDRLAMLFTGALDIREVQFFPPR